MFKKISLLVSVNKGILGQNNTHNVYSLCNAYNRSRFLLRQNSPHRAHFMRSYIVTDVIINDDVKSTFHQEGEPSFVWEQLPSCKHTMYVVMQIYISKQISNSLCASQQLKNHIGICLKHALIIDLQRSLDILFFHGNFFFMIIIYLFRKSKQIRYEVF